MYNKAIGDLILQRITDGVCTFISIHGFVEYKTGHAIDDRRIDRTLQSLRLKKKIIYLTKSKADDGIAGWRLFPS